MIRLDELGVPRPGWPGRRLAIARLVAEVVGGALIFIACMGAVVVYGLTLPVRP